MSLLNQADFSMMIAMKSWLESRGFTLWPPSTLSDYQDNGVSQSISEKIPRRCENCQSWQHLTSRCISEQIFCSVCAGPHKSRKCRMARKNGQKIAYKCANCKVSGHSAASKFCPLRPPQLSQTTHVKVVTKHKICPVQMHLDDSTVSDIFYDCEPGGSIEYNESNTSVPVHAVLHAETGDHSISQGGTLDGTSLLTPLSVIPQSDDVNLAYSTSVSTQTLSQLKSVSMQTISDQNTVSTQTIESATQTELNDTFRSSQYAVNNKFSGHSGGDDIVKMIWQGGIFGPPGREIKLPALVRTKSDEPTAFNYLLMSIKSASLHDHTFKEQIPSYLWTAYPDEQYDEIARLEHVIVKAHTKKKCCVIGRKCGEQWCPRNAWEYYHSPGIDLCDS